MDARRPPPPPLLPRHALRQVRPRGRPRGALRAVRFASMVSPGVSDFVHIGLVVEDLDETVRFLSLLGLECSKPSEQSGEWIDRIIGLDGSAVEIVMVRLPDGTDVFEIVRFRSPSAEA